MAKSRTEYNSQLKKKKDSNEEPKLQKGKLVALRIELRTFSDVIHICL